MDTLSQNTAFLLGFQNDPDVQNVLDSFTTHYSCNGEFEKNDLDNQEFLAEVIANIFTALIIADWYNEQINKDNPVLGYTAPFDVCAFDANISDNDKATISTWFAERSTLWATDEQEREYRPYWQMLLIWAEKGWLSSFYTDIQKYDALLQYIKDNTDEMNSCFDENAQLQYILDKCKQFDIDTYLEEEPLAQNDVIQALHSLAINMLN